MEPDFGRDFEAAWHRVDQQLRLIAETVRVTNGSKAIEKALWENVVQWVAHEFDASDNYNEIWKNYEADKD